MSDAAIGLVSLYSVRGDIDLADLSDKTLLVAILHDYAIAARLELDSIIVWEFQSVPRTGPNPRCMWCYMQ